MDHVQSTGAYKAASRLAIATPPPAYVLSRGIGWQVSWFDAATVEHPALLAFSCERVKYDLKKDEVRYNKVYAPNMNLF